MEGNMIKQKYQWDFPILLFDEKCPLCVRFKDSLSRVDSAEVISKVSLYNPRVYEDFPFLSQEQCLESLHLITGPQNFLIGPLAIKYLIEIYPGVKKFAWLIESETGQKAISYFYTMANKYRESLRKRCPDCRTVKRK